MTTNIENKIKKLDVRKTFVTAEEIYTEGGKPLEEPARRVVACAVFKNPWAGQEFVDDLWDKMNEVGWFLSDLLGQRLLKVVGEEDDIRGFGKASLVGTAGEIEHGAGIIHCPAFGPRFRDMVGGEAGISSIERRTTPGVSVSIPTNHKTRRSTRAYYQSVDFTLNDAPHHDEIAIALVAVTAERPHARIGDITTDPTTV